MTSLRVLTGEYLELSALADTDDEGLKLAVADTMKGIAGQFEDKAKALVCVVQNMDADLDAIETEIERLKARKKAIQNRQDDLKDWLRMNMEATGIKKIACPLFTITCAEGRETVAVYDEAAIPDEYMRVKTDIAPDKVAIAARLKAGEEVPGAKLERGQSSIRIK